MIGSDVLDELQRLTAEREPFVLATVIRARRPTSVRPGDCALVRRDGSIDGFVGGVCAESSVRLHGLRAMETGEALLLRLVPAESEDFAEVADGAVLERNPCLSGGSLEIFLEPHLPAAEVVIVGDTPIARALRQVADAAGYDCRREAAVAGPADPPERAGTVAGAAAVIVASHGHGEEEALAAALQAGVPYVALVASRTRGAAVRDELDVAPDLRAQLHTPAGLDIGARTPAEIAVAILAELIADGAAHPAAVPRRRETTAAATAEVPAAASVAVDPVCGMNVAVAPATLQLRCRDRTVYFCGPGCRSHYAEQHADELVS